MSVATEARPLTISETSILDEFEKEFGKRYRVILHNNDTTPFVYVVDALMQVLMYSHGEAQKKTWEAHTDGHAVVHECGEQEAKAYAYALNQRQVPATVEPIPN